MFCFDIHTDTTYAFINVYANPNRECHHSLKNTIPVLLQNLHRLKNIQIVQGDFNLHCAYWDEETQDNPAVAWDLIRGLQEQRLSLVNDESIPTFFHANHRPQVLDLIWICDDAYSWHQAEIVYDIVGANVDHKTLTLQIGHNSPTMFGNPQGLQSYIASGSKDEGLLFDAIFHSVHAWSHGDVNTRAQQMINTFQDKWDKYAKPGVQHFNRWWNKECRMAKDAYLHSNSIQTRATFLQQCQLAKKAFFAKKVEEMVKTRKPWEGTQWIKQHAMPKVPQITHNGQVLNDLTLMFAKLHEQFVLSSTMPVASDFINALPTRPVCSWHDFSLLELEEALSTCSNASAPGPSHLSWEYLKVFCKDDDFRSFFLQLTNDIVKSGTWPTAF